jgi:serine/threonine-protein kinase
MTSFTTMTQVGYGTMHYAAPEQYRDLKSTDERTDIYALGFLLWDLFSSAWPPPDRLDNGLPDKVAAVFRRATERDPNERYQSVTDLTEDFEAALARPQ